MLIGFSITVVTGVLRSAGIPIRTTQSLWFRIKMILLAGAFINALAVPPAHAGASAGSWTSRRAATSHAHRCALSLTLAKGGSPAAASSPTHDWYDCGQDNRPFIDWAAGCVGSEKGLQ